MTRKELEKLTREELIAKAEEYGVVRPRTLTMPELVDEILVTLEKLTGQKKPRGWFGKARDLLTSVIDRGLVTDPVRRNPSRVAPAAPPPLPTVTLAEIYAAQGHFERAIITLDEVLVRDPGHPEAAKLHARFTEQLRRTRPSSPPPPAAGSGSTPPPSAGASSSAAAHSADASRSSGHADGATSATADPSVPREAVEAPETLDERSGVDEVVAIAVDPHTIYAYWEVRPTTLAELRAPLPNGALVLRVLSVDPHGEPSAQGGPAPVARDVRIDALDGDLFVRDLPASAEVRVAIGWLSFEPSHFSPIAVGLELSTPREVPVTEVAVHFGRMSAGGVADPYDALRAGGIIGDRPPPLAFSRPSREEISLGHAPEREGIDPRTLIGDGAVEITRIQTGVPTVSIERTIRRGASEQLVSERRFGGASEELGQRRHGGPSSHLGRADLARAASDGVSFRLPG